MRIFRSCATASCYEESSIGLLTSKMAILRSDWDTSTRSGCKRPTQNVSSWCSGRGRPAASMQATETRPNHSPVFAIGVSSCSFQRSGRHFARSDEISLRTWLCAAVLRTHAGEMGRGFFRSRTVGTVRRFYQIDSLEVGLHWVAICHRFHPHSVFRRSVP